MIPSRHLKLCYSCKIEQCANGVAHLFRRPQQLGCHYYERQGPVPGLVCRRFKLSCHQSSLPCPYPMRTCASVPADGPADEIVPSLAKDPNVEAEKKRALQYTNDSKKPNVHIGLRYELVKDFRATSMCWLGKKSIGELAVPRTLLRVFAFAVAGRYRFGRTDSSSPPFS